MSAILHAKNRPVRSRTEPAAPASNYRSPNYDFQDQTDAVRLVIYVPGVDASGVDIEGRSPDLIVTARKARFVRVNWHALNLEGAQLDYRLGLRLGSGLAYEAMTAEIHNGVLAVTVPKRNPAMAGSSMRLSRVA